jgi:hypothetical protein
LAKRFTTAHWEGVDDDETRLYASESTRAT